MKRLILLRHGQSVYNTEHKFTGWADAPLTEEGLRQARQAAELLKENACLPQCAYVSCLKRARQTLQTVLQSAGLSIPVHISWRLNERHYGDFQHRTRQECAARYGMPRVLACRRTFTQAPPPAADNAAAYALVPPGVIPPNAEALSDCLARLQPLLKEEVFPAFSTYDTILLAAHEDLLRALLKQLKNLSDAELEQQLVPPAAPWIFELDNTLRPQKDCLLGDPAQLHRFLSRPVL